MMRRILAFGVLAAFTILGCSDSTDPTTVDDGDGFGDFQGQIDPTAGTFVLKTIDVPHPDGTAVRIELIGRFVRDRMGPVRPGEIPLVVSIRNIDYRSLYAPAEVALSRFDPPSVSVLNPDWTTCYRDSTMPPDFERVGDECYYGFTYSSLLGDDGVLSPGETSGEKLWVFYDPEMVSFSFAAMARFGMQPGRPVISGTFFSDPNRNGVWDSDEFPFEAGAVRITGPGIEELYVPVGEGGRYVVHVREPGLYNLFGMHPPSLAPFAPLVFTTPNPLEVVLVPGRDGSTKSFEHADFGVANALEPYAHPVMFAEDDSLALDQYALMDIRLEGHILWMRIGFGGCGPEHPLQLYMINGFMESNPVQAGLLLSHDDLGELCDAWFERELAWDMRPIMEKHRQEYGEYGVVILQFQDWQGTFHRFELAPPRLKDDG